MNRPPIKAFEQLKAFCERTQCRRCVFGQKEANQQYVGCQLLDTAPCDWPCEWEGESDD